MTHQANPKYSTIARPYALAAFDYAKSKKEIAAWKSFLESAAFMARQTAVQTLFDNPKVSSAQLFDLFQEILAPLMNVERHNFLQLLAQNKRFILLPDIENLFNAYYAALEKISTATVITAISVTEAYKLKLAQALTKRTQREVTLQCEIDPALIGGAIVHIGGKVIDGSVRGKLTRLLENSLR
ncbi:MAG: ATP synthase F1 subunit delta [Gammaproteobacteria bacterium RIFCSPHIGHO2_12_FULL_45_12]|nr:MAG: ATP synthase F1 subunit delta [Gammaproteobacteria bacterium RIFCSPHIGHO2_12_FULL_45_12]